MDSGTADGDAVGATIAGATTCRNSSWVNQSRCQQPTHKPGATKGLAVATLSASKCAVECDPR